MSEREVSGGHILSYFISYHRETLHQLCLHNIWIVKLIGIPFRAIILAFHFILSLFLSYWLSLSVQCRRLICIPLSALNDSPPLCIHLTLWCCVYFVCVCVCVRVCVWAKSADTLITSSLSSEAGPGAMAVICSFGCCLTRDPRIGIICTLIIDICVWGLMRQITGRPCMICVCVHSYCTSMTYEGRCALSDL